MYESIVLKVDELDGSLRQFYEQLKSYLQKQYNGTHKTAEFSLREIRQAIKVSKTQVFRYAGDLTNLEYIKQSGGYQNKGFTYKITYWDNYQSLREKIKNNLDEQVKALKNNNVLFPSPAGEGAWKADEARNTTERYRNAGTCMNTTKMA